MKIKVKEATSYLSALKVTHESDRLELLHIGDQEIDEQTSPITVTAHAIDKMVELFEIEDRKEAEFHLLETLHMAKFVGYVCRDRKLKDGTFVVKYDRLYSYCGVQVVLDRYINEIITVYVRRDVALEVLDAIEKHGESEETLNAVIDNLYAEETELREQVLACEIANDIMLGLATVGAMDWAELEEYYRAHDRACFDLLAFLVERKSRFLKGIAFYV